MGEKELKPNYKPEPVRFPDGTTGFIMVRDYSSVANLVEKRKAELPSDHQTLDFPTDAKLRERLKDNLSVRNSAELEEKIRNSIEAGETPEAAGEIWFEGEFEPMCAIESASIKGRSIYDEPLICAVNDCNVKIMPKNGKYSDVEGVCPLGNLIEDPQTK